MAAERGAALFWVPQPNRLRAAVRPPADGHPPPQRGGSDSDHLFRVVDRFRAEQLK